MASGHSFLSSISYVFSCFCPSAALSDHRRRWPSGIPSSSVTFHLLLYYLKSVHGSRRFAVVCIPPLCMDDALVFLAFSLPLHDWLILQSVSQTFSRILADELDREIWESVEHNNWVLGGDEWQEFMYGTN